MGYKWTIAQLLDRPGGRFLLGRMASAAARRITGLDVNIAYADGRWTRRIGADLVSRHQRFDPYCVSFHQWTEQYTAQTRDYWLYLYGPKEGDTIIDVGAGQGEDTLTFSRVVGKTGRVIAVEAYPLSFKALQNSCRLNPLQNVTPVHMALMDKPGDVHIAEGSVWTENTVVTNGNGRSTTVVPAGTLDDLCHKEGIEDIAFLKMNIEGAERYALLGAEKTMPRIRHICVACHDFRASWGHGDQFRTRAFVEAFLVQHGFTVSSRPDDPRDYVRDHLYGVRPC